MGVNVDRWRGVEGVVKGVVDGVMSGWVGR